MGGGGGGASGATDYPLYIKVNHAAFLNHMAYDTGIGAVELGAGNDLTSLLNVYLAANPWTGQTAYNGANYISNILAALTTVVANIDAKITELETYLESLSTTDQIESELGQFEVGMRNINMVHSSAFVLGRQLIASSLIKEKLVIKQSILNLYTEKELKIATYKAEFNRLALIAGKEQHDMNIELDHQEALWGFEIYQKVANVLAAASGGTTSPGIKEPSALKSVLGGALSGAAAGAQISGGNPYAIGAGALLGGGAALLK